MSLTVGMRVRVIALVAVLAAAALAVGMFTLSRSAQTRVEDDTIVSHPPPATLSPARAASPRALAFARKEDPLASAGPVAAPVRPAAKTAPARKPAPAPAPVKPQPRDTGVLPSSVAAALRVHRVVVVPVVSPDAAVDDLVLREARAGARIAGAGFVAVGVSEEADVKRLTKAYKLRSTPSVLVFTSPDRLFVQLTGFVDKETVAQAATNALS